MELRHFLALGALLAYGAYVLVAVLSSLVGGMIDRDWPSAAHKATKRIAERRTKVPNESSSAPVGPTGYREAPQVVEAPPGARLRLVFNRQRERPADVKLIRDGRAVAVRLHTATGHIVVRIEAKRDGDDVLLIAYAPPSAAHAEEWERLSPQLDVVMDDLAFELAGAVAEPAPPIPKTRVAPEVQEPAEQTRLDRRGWPKR